MKMLDETHYLDDELYYNEYIDIYNIDQLADDAGQIEEDFVNRTRLKGGAVNTKRKIEEFLEQRKLDEDLYDPFEEGYFE